MGSPGNLYLWLGEAERGYEKWNGGENLFNDTQRLGENIYSIGVAMTIE